MKVLKTRMMHLLNTKAEILEEMECFPEALEVVNEALMIKEHPKLLENKSNILRAMGRYEDALVAVERAIILTRKHR